MGNLGEGYLEVLVLILLLLCKSDRQNKIPEKEKDASQALKNDLY